MRNFPVPYSNELIYSTIARAGVYQGIVSPKQLLDEVYGNRKVVATLGLPSHLGVIARHLHHSVCRQGAPRRSYSVNGVPSARCGAFNARSRFFEVAH
ncbi:Transposon Tn7 transposition protein tnsD [Shigella flexneri 2a]|nr:Transposon Tn7 transposition protein tnsD [Shigella flexneri 2a]